MKFVVTIRAINEKDFDYEVVEENRAMAVAAALMVHERAFPNLRWVGVIGCNVAQESIAGQTLEDKISGALFEIIQEGFAPKTPEGLSDATYNATEKIMKIIAGGSAI